MQAIEYLKVNFIPFMNDSLAVGKKYQLSLLTDTLKDMGAVINEKTSDPNLEEIKIKLQFVRGSIISVIAAIALKVLGVVIGSPFLMAAGTFLFYGGVSVGLIALAGVCTNNVMKTFHIKSTSTI